MVDRNALLGMTAPNVMFGAVLYRDTTGSWWENCPRNSPQRNSGGVQPAHANFEEFLQPQGKTEQFT